MNNQERGRKIREQILRDVRHHPTDIAKHIALIFSITPQAVYYHLKSLEDAGWLRSTGRAKGKKYYLGDRREHRGLFPLSANFTEDAVWRDEFSHLFEGLPENIVDICHYGFTEMVNNAIDHSTGSEVYISATREDSLVQIVVMDDGEGIFRRITRICGLTDERQALLELSKGKLTTDPDNHTGEGIFFTSRVFDEFAIESGSLHYTHVDGIEFDYLNESGIPDEEVGTAILMRIDRASTRTAQSVFDRFAGPDEYSFNKTIIPVRLAQYGNEKLISRSQAKRLLARVEKFECVVFDFDSVSGIGQAFADEIFRVYARAHPEVTLIPDKMTPDVQKMVQRALAHRGPGN